jgi:hypothetical protein
MNHKLFIILCLCVQSFSGLAQNSWGDLAQIKAQKEVEDAVFLISKLELTNQYIKGQSNLIRLDISKSSAFSSMVKAANPTSKIFKTTFVEIITSTVTDKIRPGGTVDKKNLTNALNNATHSNVLVQTLADFNPIGSVITNVMSVVNNFFQKKGGLF